MSEQAAISNSVTDSSAAALAAQQAVAAAEGGQGEKLYAGKYKSIEDLEKGYLEAQKLISSRGTETPAAQTPAANAPAIIETPAAPQPLDWDGLNKEYADSGSLSDDTYGKLEKSGFPRDVVDAYIEGRKSQAASFDNAIYGAVGGAEQYASMVEWAKTNMTKDEIAGYNAAITSGNINQAKLAVEGLAGRYRAKNGSAPGLLNGSTSSGGGAQPFKSEAEVVQAMNSPQYRNDPAYRKDVLERLKVSEVFG